MTNDEADRFLATAQAGYEAQLTEFGGLGPDEARRKAATDHARLVPDGRLAPGLHLFVAEASGVAVGHLWLAEPAVGGPPDTAYVYDVEVREEQRGRGYGGVLMEAAEQWATSLGASYLALNVFGGNRVARRLYESLGYETTSVDMRKSLARSGG
jgi:GNAT superfamily N-acetyltransferase